MGNTFGKEKSEDAVDGGQLTAHGLYKGPHDWEPRIVRKLIMERKLAPFYKGMPDYDEAWDDAAETQILPKNASLPRTKDSLPPKSLEAQLYKGAVECPICFLYYPRNINRSRCCDQPICTECFLQMKRPESGSLGANNSPAVCPFCVEPNFGICYKPPSFSMGLGNESTMSCGQQPQTHVRAATTLPSSPSSSSLGSHDVAPRRKSMSHRDSEVVTTDQVRPARVLQPQRQADSHRPPSFLPPGVSGRRPPVRAFATPPSVSPRRSNLQNVAEYSYLNAMRSMGTDLEELMVMEAIRLSLLEQEERERRLQDQEHVEHSSGQSDHNSEPSFRETRVEAFTNAAENPHQNIEDFSSEPGEPAKCLPASVTNDGHAAAESSTVAHETSQDNDDQETQHNEDNKQAEDGNLSDTLLDFFVTSESSSTGEMVDTLTSHQFSDSQHLSSTVDTTAVQSLIPSPPLSPAAHDSLSYSKDIQATESTREDASQNPTQSLLQESSLPSSEVNDATA